MFQSQQKQIVHESLSWKKKKNLPQKRAGGVVQGASPEFKPQYHKKKKKKNWGQLLTTYPIHKNVPNLLHCSIRLGCFSYSCQQI
jgi:predicted AAA+ superfamily ATPase